MITLRSLASICLALCTLTHAAAQDQMLKLRFVSFPRHQKMEPVELLVGNGQLIKVEIPGHELSPEYEVPALKQIVVGKSEVSPEGKPFFDVYGKGTPVAGAKRQIILLMRKGGPNKDGFLVMPINGELDDFEGGSFLFINAASVNVGGLIGDAKFALKPGQQQLIKPKANHDNGVCQVTFSYQRPDKWKTFFDTRWPANHMFRSLVFFYQNPSNGSIGVAPIVEMLDGP